MRSPRHGRERFLATAIISAVILAWAVRPATAQPPDLKRVPPDAAVFGYIDVQAVWSSPIGESIRNAKSAELAKAFEETRSKSGVTPDMVKSLVFFIPILKQPGDFNTGVIHIAFLKPYDRETIYKGLKTTKTDYTEKDGLVTIKTPGGPGQLERSILIDLTSPDRISIYAGVDEKYRRPAVGEGPMTPALRAAAGEGVTAALGVNMAAMPDEIRGEDVPAEVRPFQPLFKSDTLIAVGKLDGGELKLDVRFRSSDRPRVIEAEKSLAAGVTLLQTALGYAVDQLGRSGSEDEKAMQPFVQRMLEVVKGARVSSDGQEAKVTAVVRTDVPLAGFIRSALGGGTGVNSRARDQNNLKQIALAMHNYHDAHGGFPPAAVCDRRGKPMLSWRVLLLPYLEQENLYRKFKLDEPWDSEHNKKVLEENPIPQVYLLPGTKAEEKLTHYQVFVRNGALFDPLQTVKMTSITDGLSNTLLVVTGKTGVPWTKPDELEYSPKVDPRTQLLFKDGGCNVALGDGSVRFLRNTIVESVLRAVITKSGGEPISPEDL